MDPICEEKFNFLQKYVPFLANLIELLANDSEKEGKLAQMQLLYNLLNKPDNSVKIETLEKCEEVLSRVFGNTDEKHEEDEINEASDKKNAKLLISCEVEQQIKVENVEVSYENVNGCTNHENQSSEIEGESLESHEISPEQKTLAVGLDVSDTAAGESETEINQSDEGETSKSQGEEVGCTSIKGLPDNEKNETTATDDESNHLNGPEANDCLLEENCLLDPVDETTVEESSYIPEAQIDESDTFILPDDGENLKSADEDLNSEEHVTSTDAATNCEGQPEDTDRTENEDEESPEEQQTDVIRQNQEEMLPFKIISAESLVIQSVQSLSGNDDLSLLKPVESDNKDDEISETQSNDTAKEETQDDDIDPLDPLTDPQENLVKIPESVPIENGTVNLNHTTKENNNDDDDDDDDVLLIETRSSPICIDSDPEDEENVKKTRSLPIKPSKNSLTIQRLQRSNARKSTATVADTIRRIIKHQDVSIMKVPSHKKPKPQRASGYLLKKDPKALMETINLIDSDSDDEIKKKTQKSKTNDDDVIIVSSTQPRRKPVPQKKASSLISPNKPSMRFPQRLLNKPPAKPPTAQSNFLNAVNLQPAPKSHSNPATFSAQLSNKRVIIPNAFYGNPAYNRKPSSSSAVIGNIDESSSNDSVPRGGSSSTVSVRQVEDRMLKEWLEGFLTNFASPLQLASHACFVLLQRVLKYRFFYRLKETRVVLNTLAKNCVTENVDVQMLLDLRNVFLENDNLTESGRRFCRFATNEAFGKPVALTTDSRTGKVTCRTRSGSKSHSYSDFVGTSKPNTPDKASTALQVPASNATVTSANNTQPTTPISNITKRNRKLRKLSDGVTDCDADDNDYTPYKGDMLPEEEVVSERKKSLRTNRTKRKEAGFTYSEDHDDEEFEALAKKLENKKREELRIAEEKELEKERERERKAKKTVAKKTTSKRQSNPVPVQMEIPKEPTRKKLRLADTEILGSADDDLLTPTWIEAEGEDGDEAEVDSLLDFADEPQSPASEHDNKVVEEDPVPSVAEESEDSDSYPPSFDVGTNKSLKNTDRKLHTHSKTFDFCVHCLKRVSRTVHHYVNEHRSSEVFTSRLRTKDIRRLLTTSNVGFVSLYKGNQQQYSAHCIFCDKEAKFLLPYWFEHFTMHTGEYNFKCTGCNIRKPTRSLLTNHLQSGTGCPKKGTAVRLHLFDTKSNLIEAHICAVCNYIQVHRKNLLKHLRTQHGVETVSPNHIIRVVLLQVSGPYRDQQTIKNDASQLSLLHHSDDEETSINGTTMTSSIDDSSLMMQNDFTDNDDLSFMICGMLDVQTNLSATGDLLGNVDTTNTVDNK